MKRVLIILTALAVSAPAAAWTPVAFLDRTECNREAAKQRKANKDPSAFYVCVFDDTNRVWVLWANNR